MQAPGAVRLKRTAWEWQDGHVVSLASAALTCERSDPAVVAAAGPTARRMTGAGPSGRLRRAFLSPGLPAAHGEGRDVVVEPSAAVVEQVPVKTFQ